MIKWNLQNILTNMMNKIIQGDSYTDNIFYFHKLVTDLINYEFSESVLIKKYESIIKLIYKGGSAMYIVYRNFQDQIKKNSELNKLSIFLNNFQEDFSRSDADFIIVIDKKKINKKIFLNLYLEINKKITIALYKLRNIISNNIDIYYNYNAINFDDINKILRNMNNYLNENKKNTRYDVINSLIGLSLWNKDYLLEEIPSEKESISNFNIGHNIILKPIILKKDSFNEYNLTNKKRRDYYVTAKYTKDLEDEYDMMLIQLNNNISNNEIYYYLNENYNYKALNEHKVGFCLHRLKLNSILYYKTSDKDQKDIYGYMNCPAEIIDVSIKKWEDDFNVNIELETMEYTYKHRIYGDYKFNSFTIYGFIVDLYENLCVHNKYPWEDKKYEKRLKRLIYFILIDLIDNKEKEELIDILTNYIQFIEKLYRKEYPEVNVDDDNDNDYDDNDNNDDDDDDDYDDYDYDDYDDDYLNPKRSCSKIKGRGKCQNRFSQNGGGDNIDLIKKKYYKDILEHPTLNFFRVLASYLKEVDILSNKILSEKYENILLILLCNFRDFLNIYKDIPFSPVIDSKSTQHFVKYQKYKNKYLRLKNNGCEIKN
jgi:hypothetical protein